MPFTLGKVAKTSRALGTGDDGHSTDVWCVVSQLQGRAHEVDLIVAMRHVGKFRRIERRAGVTAGGGLKTLCPDTNLAKPCPPQVLALVPARCVMWSVFGFEWMHSDAADAVTSC